MVSEEFTLNQNGTLSFEWKMDNASLYDYLGYDIYNVTNNSYLSGNSVPDYTNCLENLHRKSTAANYTTVTYNLPAGTYKVLFMYGKDGSIDDQNTGVTDKGYVKNIQVTGASGFTYGDRAGEFTQNCDVYAKWEDIWGSKTYKLKTGSEFNALIPTSTAAIEFTDVAMPYNATPINVDADGDGGVVGWLDGTTFKISTQKPGQKVILNENSKDMFNGLENYVIKNVVSIDFKNVDTSIVTDMSYMFYYAGYNATSFNIKNLSGWDTSKVTDMLYMFYNAGYSATTWSIGDISN